MSHDADRIANRRKRKAVLAGGVVLGLGAAMTLAAWTDGVWVSGSFAAGSFNVQGAVDGAGTVWQEYDSPSGGGLIFTVSPTAMTPGDSVYAPLNLKVGPNQSEYDAQITLPVAPTGPTVTDTANNALFNSLRVSLYNVAPTACNAAGTTGAAMANFSGAPLNTTKNTVMLTLDGTTQTPQGVCFKVTLPADAPSTVQGGQTGQLVWNFHAESIPG